MDNIDVGELLINMFMLCKQNNVNISISIADRDVLGPNVFGIRLDRGGYSICKFVDTTHMCRDPKDMVNSTFRYALYDLNYVAKEE